MIPEIHASLLVNTFTQEASASSSASSAKQKEEIFDALKSLLLFEVMHSLVMESWKNFRESLSKLAERKNEDYKYLERREQSQRAAEREAEKRHIEVFNETFEGRRKLAQAGDFTPIYSDSGRNLYFPV